MITCPECGYNHISSHAYFCPDCGRPIKPFPNKRYVLKTKKPRGNAFATLLRFCAVIVLIVGLVISYQAGHTVDVKTAYSGMVRTEEVFSWGLFLTALIPYLINTFVLWSLGTVVQHAEASYQMLYWLRLGQEEIGKEKEVEEED